MRERLSLRWKTAGVAWPDTRAFVIENANEGYVRINLRGREPLGIVEPGGEHETLCDQIREVAMSLTNPETGRAAAHAVLGRTTSALVRAVHMPDVAVIWDTDAKVTGQLQMAKHGLIRRPSASCELPPYYTGNHAPHAFALAFGPEVPKGFVYTDRSASISRRRFSQSSASNSRSICRAQCWASCDTAAPCQRDRTRHIQEEGLRHPHESAA